MSSHGPIQLVLEFAVQNGQVTIDWESTTFDNLSTHFDRPYDEKTLPLVIKALDYKQYPVGQPPSWNFSADDISKLEKVGLWKANCVSDTTSKAVGLKLYRALGAKGRAMMERVRNLAIEQQRSVNYVLRFPKGRDGVYLAALPWELIADEDHQWILLSRGTGVDSCERYINMNRSLPPRLSAKQHLHLLALLPKAGIPDELRQAEQKARSESWQQLDGKYISYSELTPLTMSRLDDYISNVPQRPDIVHYFGHGIYRDGEGYLLFDEDEDENEDGTGTKLISAESLAAALGGVRLIVLHACQSAMITDEGSNLLTGVAPALSTVADAVVAMQLTVQTDVAIRFSESFYHQLLVNRRSVQEAAAIARQHIFSEFPNCASWYVPTVYIHSREQKPFYLQHPPQKQKQPPLF